MSLVELEHNELITGGLTDKNGKFMITDIPLGRYAAVIEFIGYRKKEVAPINLYPVEGGGIRQTIPEISLAISAVNMDAIEVLGEESTFIQTIDTIINI